MPANDSTPDSAAPRPYLSVLLGLATLIPSIAFWLGLDSLYRALNEDIDRTQIVGTALVAGLFGAALFGFLFVRTWSLSVRLALAIAWLLWIFVGVYFFFIALRVIFPGDFLIWSESSFVNDILKYRVGHPMYTDQRNGDSFIYTPGVPLITGWIAQAVGYPNSIPVFRFIQLMATIVAAVFAMDSARILSRLHPISDWATRQWVWPLVAFPFLFLTATNIMTNAYVYMLHNDAFAQLSIAMIFWALVRYERRRSTWAWWMLVIMPTMGFWMKQSVAIWAPLICLYFLLFDNDRSWRRLISYGLASFGLLGSSILLGWLAWGEPFRFWVFTVLAANGTSMGRALDHFVQASPFVFMGVLGGALLMNHPTSRGIVGIWCLWLLLFVSEAWSSGIAWMLNHLGPGSLLAAVWGVAAFPILGRQVFPEADSEDSSLRLRGAMATIAVAVLMLSFGLHYRPTPGLVPDALRYFRNIAAEFDGMNKTKVLLDAGTTFYLNDGIVMRDRVTGCGDRGRSGIGDFSGAVARIESQTYDKILVRHLNEEEFWYDGIWPKSSGIRDALLRNYEPLRSIKPVQSPDVPIYYFFDGVSVLVPRGRPRDAVDATTKRGSLNAEN